MAEKNGVNGRTAVATNGKASYAERNQVADHFVGGNRLANAAAGKVKDFVAQNDGHTVITNVSYPQTRHCSSPEFALVRMREHQDVIALTRCSTGLDRQQRHRSRQGDPVRTEMGLRDVRR
jgi:hypothetical protein